MMEANFQSVIDLPLSQRRYIAVLSDKEFDRTRLHAKDNSSSDLELEAVPLIVSHNVLVRTLSNVSPVIGWAVKKAVKIQAAKVPVENNRGDLIQAIPLREANKFRFLGGCAEVGKAYAANPLQDDTYYSVETYNDDMIDHKLSELERILNGLGAKSYQINFDSDEQHNAQASITPKNIKQINAVAELRNARAKRYERNGTSIGRDPVLPKGLVWLEREPSWQALVESRLEHGRQDFGLKVNLERDLQISAKVSADFKMLGVDAGAEYKRRMNFTLTVKGSFGSG